MVRYQRTPARGRHREDHGSAPWMYRMVLELGDEAGMGRTLRILMQEVVKIRRDFQRAQPEPQREHGRHGQETADSAPTLSYHQKLHAELQ